MTAITAEKVEKYKRGIQLVGDGMSIRKAATILSLPYENLRVRVTGVVPVACRTGPMLTYLSDGAAEGLLEVIEHRTSRGFCVGFAELRFLIRQAAIVSARRQVPKTFPDRKFVGRWIKKHSDNISFRKARILEGKRAEASTEEVVRYYFGNLEQAIDQLKLRNCPSQIWNCDETGVSPQGRCQQRVITPIGMPANVLRSDDRENVSIMGCINAAGDHMPPMYIFAGKRRKVEWMKNAPPGAVCAMTESSNINGFLFRHWVKWFVRRLPAVRPQLLILDGHFAHIDYDTVVWAQARGVHIFCLPAHTSHFLQPLDVGVYQPFKRLYEGELELYPLITGYLPTKDDIVRLTKLPFENALAAQNAISAFKNAGIYPLSVDIMLAGLVGNKPCIKKQSLLHHAVVVPHVEAVRVSERQQRDLERKRLNLDALNVVNIAVRSSATPKTKGRMKGTYVDEKFSGGVLLTHAEMLAALERKKTAKADKERAKKRKAEEKACAIVEKERAKNALARRKALEKAERDHSKAKQAEAKAHAKADREEERRLMRLQDKKPRKKRKTGIIAWVDV
ncbi:hypothetical protein PR001_g21717 [Phytophthora rubi]|uniref:DDE-1 domain-containing protein n=1 Tax=Phytophthora rubi TaxID=129364 RepID=A0A6A3J4T1_9STRA|nr:hypothetical protein PR001_g21717 [Phytophthora rubi]